MEFKNARFSTNVISSLITLVVVGLLIFAGPAQAFSASLGSFNDSNPFVGDLVSTTATIEILAVDGEVSIPYVNLTVDDSQYCIFNTTTGAVLGGCVGMTINVLETAPYGYGYGYGFTEGSFEYNITINTSEFFSPGQTYSLKLIAGSVESSVVSLSIGAVLEDPFFEDVSFLLPDGQNDSTNITNVTINNDWIVNNLTSDGIEVFVPEGTVISGSNGSNINVTAITSSLTTVSSLSNLEDMKGALQFGIPGFGLTFSNPVTIKINVGTSLNGQRLTAYRSLGLSGPWESITTCVVSAGVCEFNTTKASYFVAADTPIVSSSGSRGGYCSTEWSCTEWSACDNGIQTRVCTYPSSFCAPTAEKPIETTTCVVDGMPVYNGDDSVSDEKAGFFSLMTGFVIGNLLENPVNMTISILILLVIVALLWLVVYKRKKKVVKKTKKK